MYKVQWEEPMTNEGILFIKKENGLFYLEKIEKAGKGKYRLCFKEGNMLCVYASEMRGMNLEEGTYLSEEQYRILYDIVGKRAKKRALHLLEQMDRTEQQLREKLIASEYPMECVEDAIAYVKSFHYINDQRYADTFTRYSKEKLSRRQIQHKLMQKGISKELTEQALEREYDVDESEHIRRLLEKKHFFEHAEDEREKRRMYQYLLRRGFRSSDILKEMN